MIDPVVIERVARAIDPDSFRRWQEMYDYCVRQDDDEETAKFYADQTYGKNIEQARAAATAALSASPLEQMAEALKAARPFVGPRTFPATAGSVRQQIDAALSSYSGTKNNEG